MKKKYLNKQQEQQYTFPYHHLPSIEPDTFSQHRSLLWGCEYASYLYFVINKIKSLRFGSLLDIGCGDGKLILELSRCYQSRILAGADPSAKALAFAKAFNPQITFYQSSITDHKLKNKTFELATLIDVLEHIPLNEINNFIFSISKLLAKNGKLLLTVPTINLPLNPKHFQHFTLAKLTELFDKYFQVKNSYYLNTIGLRSWLIGKLLQNKFFILNNNFLKTLLYKFYLKYLLLSNSKKGSRIYLLLQKR